MGSWCIEWKLELEAPFRSAVRSTDYAEAPKRRRSEAPQKPQTQMAEEAVVPPTLRLLTSGSTS
jgi:hypothetical protein